MSDKNLSSNTKNKDKPNALNKIKHVNDELARQKGVYKAHARVTNSSGSLKHLNKIKAEQEKLSKKRSKILKEQDKKYVKHQNKLDKLQKRLARKEEGSDDWKDLKGEIDKVHNTGYAVKYEDVKDDLNLSKTRDVIQKTKDKARGFKEDADVEIDNSRNSNYTNKLKDEIKRREQRIKNARKKNYFTSKPVNQGYSGSDIVAQFKFPEELNEEPEIFAELSTLAYSTYRDKFPVRSLGHIKAKGYTTGTRTVAGTLIFKVLDKNIINKMTNLNLKQSENILPDELPPFNINITFSNEAGQSTKLSLVGVEITEGNQIMSSEELSTDETYSFVAHDLRMLEIEGRNAFEQHDNERQRVMKERRKQIEKLEKEVNELHKQKTLSQYTYSIPPEEKNRTIHLDEEELDPNTNNVSTTPNIIDDILSTTSLSMTKAKLKRQMEILKKQEDIDKANEEILKNRPEFEDLI